jgi:mitochondrial inner membrane protease subunit 1
MLPTLADEGDGVFENKRIFRLHPERIARGDLITLESPIQRGRIACKRVIGLPGDVVCVDPTGLMAPSSEHVIVPRGHIWVMGDNAALSIDSRTYGPIPIALVRGKVTARVCFLFVSV